MTNQLLSVAFVSLHFMLSIVDAITDMIHQMNVSSSDDAFMLMANGASSGE